MTTTINPEWITTPNGALIKPNWIITLDEYLTDGVYGIHPLSQSIRDKFVLNQVRATHRYNINFPPVDKSWLRRPQADVMPRMRAALYRRNEFIQFMKQMGWTFTEMCERMDGLYLPKHPRDIPLRIAAISEQISEKAAEREKRVQHHRRLNVSRVAMRTGLPSDLVPWICAFAVSGSKQYPYMWHN